MVVFLTTNFQHSEPADEDNLQTNQVVIGFCMKINLILLAALSLLMMEEILISLWTAGPVCSVLSIFEWN